MLPLQVKNSFTTTDGRRFTIDISVATIRRIKSKLDLDLLAIFEDGNDTLTQLATNPVLLADVLWVCLEEQAARHELDDEKFGQMLAGENIEVATAAFLEGLTLFFPPGKRATLAKAINKIREVEKLDAELAIQRLEHPKILESVRIYHKKMMEKMELIDLTNPQS